MELEDIIALILVVGLAVVAVRNLFVLPSLQTKRARTGYIAGLVAGAGLGLGIAAENGGGYSIGLAIGLGASVAGGYAVELLARRAGSVSPSVAKDTDHDPASPSDGAGR